MLEDDWKAWTTLKGSTLGKKRMKATALRFKQGFIRRFWDRTNLVASSTGSTLALLSLYIKREVDYDHLVACFVSSS